MKTIDSLTKLAVVFLIVYGLIVLACQGIPFVIRTLAGAL
jgi:hypothetical protein